MQDKKYGCIGKTLKHSFSQTIHDILTPKAGYCLWELPDDDSFRKFMSEKSFEAVNVTIPYKQAVLPFLSWLSPEAEKIGAVNTIVKQKDGSLFGYNTDYRAIKALISYAGIDIKGKKTLICGTGGTSLTALAAAKELGAKEIYRLSRAEHPTEQGIISYDRACGEHNDAEIIINTTPAGMYPDKESTPIELSCFPRLYAVIDAVYNPLRTKLITAAKKRGLIAAGGLYMLVSQAVFASELFFNCEYKADLIGQITNSLSKQKENIVLTGMPASGKSSIGKQLAKELGREFFDSDTLIEQESGMKIADFFALYGEEKFRDEESRIIREKLSNVNGAVIATGGGVIKREENTDLLKQNGRIFFLDKALSGLLPTKDRPLAQNRQDLEKLYYERRPLYLNTADVKIILRSDIAQAVKDIKEYL